MNIYILNGGYEPYGTMQKRIRRQHTVYGMENRLRFVNRVGMAISGATLILSLLADNKRVLLALSVRRESLLVILDLKASLLGLAVTRSLVGLVRGLSGLAGLLALAAALTARLTGGGAVPAAETDSEEEEGEDDLEDGTDNSTDHETTESRGEALERVAELVLLVGKRGKDLVVLVALVLVVLVLVTLVVLVLVLVVVIVVMVMVVVVVLALLLAVVLLGSLGLLLGLSSEVLLDLLVRRILAEDREDVHELGLWRGLDRLLGRLVVLMVLAAVVVVVVTVVAMMLAGSDHVASTLLRLNKAKASKQAGERKAHVLAVAGAVLLVVLLVLRTRGNAAGLDEDRRVVLVVLVGLASDNLGHGARDLSLGLGIGDRVARNASVADAEVVKVDGAADVECIRADG